MQLLRTLPAHVCSLGKRSFSVSHFQVDTDIKYYNQIASATDVHWHGTNSTLEFCYGR